jgi:hypothetical protein
MYFSGDDTPLKCLESRIYFSGDDIPLKRLELMDEYLSEFDVSPSSRVGSIIPWQMNRFSEPFHEQHLTI